MMGLVESFCQFELMLTKLNPSHVAASYDRRLNTLAGSVFAMNFCLTFAIGAVEFRMVRGIVKGG